MPDRGCSKPARDHTNNAEANCVDGNENDIWNYVLNGSNDDENGDLDTLVSNDDDEEQRDSEDVVAVNTSMTGGVGDQDADCARIDINEDSLENGQTDVRRNML